MLAACIWPHYGARVCQIMEIGRMALLRAKLLFVLLLMAVPAMAQETVQVELVGRDAIVAAPAAPSGLIVVLHGGGGRGAQIRRSLTELETAANARGFVVAYLDGSPARGSG